MATGLIAEDNERKRRQAGALPSRLPLYCKSAHLLLRQFHENAFKGSQFSAVNLFQLLYC